MAAPQKLILPLATIRDNTVYRVREQLSSDQYIKLKENERGRANKWNEIG